MCVHLYTTEYQDVKGQRLYPLAPISLLLGEGSRQFVQFESENVRYARFFFSERQTHQNAIQSLFERSEFLIDTSQKKSLRVCPCARRPRVRLILVLVWGRQTVYGQNTVYLCLSKYIVFENTHTLNNNNPKQCACNNCNGL